MRNQNSREFTELVSDKYRAYLLLNKEILMPHTELYDGNYTGFVKEHGLAVLKPRFSKKGEGIYFERRDVGKDYMIQKRIEAKDMDGHVFDVRVYICTKGSLSIYSYARVSAKGSLLTNIAQGGTAQSADAIISKVYGNNNPLREIRDMTVKIILRLPDFVEAGLDFMIDKEGTPYLLEVNYAPGIQGFYRLAQAQDFLFGNVSLTYDDDFRSSQTRILNRIIQKRKGEAKCAV